MNVRLLRKVARHIDAEPRRLDMAVVARASAEAPCGTAGCIAGWALMLTRKPDRIDSYSNFPVFGDEEQDASHAEQLLAIDNAQAYRLFYVSQWPKKFANRHEKAKTKRARANATLARIEHFIKTKGAE